MKILVIGGLGFIGSYLTNLLFANAGAEVTVLDNLSNCTGNNLRYLRNIQFINEDISWYRPKPEYDLIYYLACHPRSKSFENPLRDIDVNIRGVVNALECSRKKNIPIVFASNSGIYDTSKIPISEKMRNNPTSPYDLDKLTAESYIKLYHKLYDVPYTIFRFAAVYGSRQHITPNWQPVIMLFINNILDDQPCIIDGDGQQTRDFINVLDITAALYECINKSYGGPILLGTGIETSINQLATYLYKLMDCSENIRYGPRKFGDIKRMCYKSDLAKKKLGWEPKIELVDGLYQTIHWVKDQRRIN